MFFDKKGMTSYLNISHEIMSDFVSFPLSGFTLVIKLRNFGLESHGNTLIIDQKNDVTFEYVLSNSV